MLPFPLEISRLIKFSSLINRADAMLLPCLPSFSLRVLGMQMRLALELFRCSSCETLCRGKNCYRDVTSTKKISALQVAKHASVSQPPIEQSGQKLRIVACVLRVGCLLEREYVLGTICALLHPTSRPHGRLNFVYRAPMIACAPTA